jgi:hypothetical protein
VTRKSHGGIWRTATLPSGSQGSDHHS